LQGSLMYRDKRLAGYDAAAVVEVIEHLDPPRLAAFQRNVFEFARPGTVLVTTPNAEYNVKFESLPRRPFSTRGSPVRVVACRVSRLGEPNRRPLLVCGSVRFVRKEPLRRVHEWVFGVLALESEPVDPRL
jgi:hypothetical protein